MPKKNEPVFSADAGPSLHTARWKIGEFELDETRRELRLNGVLIAIEPKPLNLLMQFARKPGELITKSELMETLWTGTIVSDAVLSNSVKKLRDALDPRGTEWIKTVHGFGYRFDGPVVLVASDSGTPLAPTLALKPGDLVPGRSGWQLVIRLGSAGDSWLAQHRKLPSRRVFKFTNDARALVALKREVTIFRLLKQSLGDNRDYVDLIDWNFDEPPWFLEAEYCDGGSLQEWLTSIGGPQTLTQDVRIELIARIADALSAVHQLGVLHKDLKPGNVLIVPGADGECPQIKLGDFGSGRVLDAQRLTELGISRVGVTESALAGDSTSGTPLYYAPEVLAGHPPTLKADLYALGIMLYQLAAGDLRLVFAPGWERNIDDPLIREDIAAVSEGDPSKRMADASELARRLRSLPERREARAQAVADANRIEEERIAERARIDAAERAVERLRARRFGLRIAVAALLGGVTVSTALYLKARTAQHRAEASVAQSHSIIDYLAKGIFERIDSNKSPTRNLSVKEVLDSASEEMSKRFQSDPALEAELRRSLGRSYAALEYEREAVRELERAMDLYEKLEGTGSVAVVEAAADLVINKYSIGEIATFRTRANLIEQEGKKHLGASAPAVLKLRLENARTDYLTGRTAAAARSLSTLVSELPASMPDHELLAGSTRSLLGLTLSELGRYGEAESQLRSVLASRVKTFGENHLRVARAHMQLGVVLVESGRLDEAQVELERARDIAKSWINDSDGESLAMRWYQGRILAGKGALSEAAHLLEQVIIDADRTSEVSASEAGPIRRSLAEVYTRQGRLREAEALLRRAEEDVVATAGAAHSNALNIRLDLARLLANAGRDIEAARVLDKDPRVEFPDLPKSHPSVVELIALREKLTGSLRNSVTLESSRIH